MAQINLAEAAAAGALPDMPAAGWLVFFYDEENQPWGFDPKDRGGWRVLFFEGEAASLRRMVPPVPVAPEPRRSGLLGRLLGRKPPPTHPAAPLDPFVPHAVRFEAQTTLPELGEFLIDDDEDDDRWEALEELQKKLEPEDDNPNHRLGDHPSQIQGDMRLESQLASNGVYCGNSYDSPRDRALEAGANDWHLLLQIDSDDYTGWMWGDVGRVYFLIRHQDLAARDFDNVWCIPQCY